MIHEGFEGYTGLEALYLIGQFANTYLTDLPQYHTE